MTDTKTMDDEEEHARKHLTVVAFGLCRKFGPAKAAALMAGSFSGVVEHELKLDVPTWLRELAEEYERDERVVVCRSAVIVTDEHAIKARLKHKP